MGNPGEPLTRRRAIECIVAGGIVALLQAPRALAQQGPAVATRRIPSSGEAVPVVGLGTWITFNVGGRHRRA